MATWRTKGYVSDSEGEDDDLDTAWNNLAPQNVPSAQDVEGPTAYLDTREDLSHGLAPEREPSPRAKDAAAPSDFEGPQSKVVMFSQPLPPLATTAEALQQTLSQGLQVVRDVLSRSPSPPIILRTLDEADSPLSTPPDSPAIQSSALPAPPAAEDNAASQVQTIEVLPAPRTFRQRNPIQQNPYTLDRAKYMITLAGTGHKPIRDVDNFPKRIAHTEQSQDSSFEESNQAEEFYDQDSMEIDRPVGFRTSNRPPSVSFVRDDSSWDVWDEELPDLGLLLNPPAAFGATRSRSMLQSRGCSTHIQSSQIFDLPTSDDEGRRKTSKVFRKLSPNEQQNSIPSPPRSMSVGSLEMPPLQDDPVGTQSPAPLPTPLVSSGMRPRKRLIIEDDSQSVAENEPTSIKSGVPAETDTSDGEQEEPRNLRVMQRRVKGVLPASWWNIDRLQTDLKGKSKDTTRAAVKPRQEIGVAQRKTNLIPNRGGNRGFNLALYDDLASEESDDDIEKQPENRYRQTSLPLESPKLANASLPRNDEAMEIVDEDGIDPMLPARSYTGASRSNRQTDIRDFDAEQCRRASSSKFPQRRHTGGSPAKIKMQSRKKARRKRPDDIIEILDAPGLRSLPHKSRASFLRVAARHAKKRSRPAGSSASRKFFQLSTSDETDDVLSSLRTYTSSRHVKSSPTAELNAIVNRAGPVYAENRPRSSRSPNVHGQCSRPVAPPVRPQRRDSRTVQTPDGQRQENEAFTQLDYPLERDADAAQFLRLTRLRSLLPIKNRSGYGRLASRPLAPRAAQLEVIRPGYKTLSSGVAKAPSLRNLPSEDKQRDALPTRRPFTADSVIHLVGAASHTRKKRTPKRSETVKQTLLIPQPSIDRDLQVALDSNDPNLGALLHAEFSDYQTAWFEGRKLGVLCANEVTQHHFDIFIRVLKSYLSVALQDHENCLDARKLNSFIHRLLPNRREIGAQGQIGDKTLDVLEQDIAVAGNVFALHVCLLNLAPGCAPRPRVLEMKVNFSEAHHEICVIALSAWKEIYMCHHADRSIIWGLANWMYSILSQLMARWAAAEIDARADAGRSDQRVAPQLMRRVIELNRSQACHLLCQAHRLLETSIRDAVSMTEASTLLESTSYLKHLDCVTATAEMAEDVLITALRVVKCFVNQAWVAQQPTDIAISLLGPIRRSITSLTTSREHLSQDLEKAVIEIYFTFAQVAVKQRQKCWDNFFEPTSSFSLDMFVSQHHLETMKTLFYHSLIKNETDQYFLDFRAEILNHWLRCLFQNRDDNFADLLTLSLFKHENESLAMATLASSFSSADGDFSEEIIKQSLPEIRHSVVMEILPYLYSQEHNSEAEWLAGGLDDADAVRLLRTMFSTMKETWMSLREQPEEQDMYTILVHSALDQYEIYPRSDFKVESWFFNSATFPQRRKHTLVKLLSGRQQDKTKFLQKAKEVFEQEVAHAQRYRRFDALEQELKGIFLPRLEEGTYGNEGSSNIMAMHATFIRDTFPAYIAATDPSLTEARTTVLNVLVHVLDNLECGLPSFCWQPFQPLVQAIEPVINAVRGSIANMQAQDRGKVFELTGLAFMWAAKVLDEISERFVDDIEAICDIAAEGSSEEAKMLLQIVISKR